VPFGERTLIPHNSSEGGEAMNYENEFEIFASVIRSLERDTGDDMASEIFQAIGTAKAITDGLKTLSSYADEIKDIGKHGEFMRVIGQLKVDLAEAQTRLSEKIREVNELGEQVNTLKKEVESLKNPDTKLTVRDGVYYGQGDDGPFCTGCYDNNGKLIRVTELTNAFMPMGKYKCPICKSYAGRE